MHNLVFWIMQICTAFCQPSLNLSPVIVLRMGLVWCCAGSAAWISRSLRPAAAIQRGTEEFPGVKMGQRMEWDSSTFIWQQLMTCQLCDLLCFMLQTLIVFSDSVFLSASCYKKRMIKNLLWKCLSWCHFVSDKDNTVKHYFFATS